MTGAGSPPIFGRLERSGARNVQVRAPQGARDVLDATSPGAAISSSSTRPARARAPGGAAPTPNGASGPARWSSASRTRPRRSTRAARFVKPGGRIVYVTCSVLKAENEDRVAAFLETHADFLPLDAAHMARSAGLPALAEHASGLGAGLRLSPHRTHTDGFYVAALTRS